MLMPKKVKHRRVMKGRMRGIASRGDKLNFGDFGLKTLEAALDYRPPNRSGSYRDDAPHQARRKSLDSHVSRQADYEKTG